MRQRVLCAILSATILFGCQTTDSAMRAQMQPWVGQPVRAFAERYSLAPADVWNTANGGRTYIYQKPGAFGSVCGVTIRSVAGDSEYIIKEMESTCPPGSLS